ncbi:hypothetical protein FGIG_06614 [Fasciola gigantica]|uniref:Palmitoyltransferase n=1 Tax=Fasciola gigantica TaxID=46835 RepID=A0A504Z6T7_FASGI|nr:hypothetical protein FGIG_06614 [Fasciola gigantica]
MDAVLQQPGFQTFDENACSPFDLLHRYTGDEFARYILRQKTERFMERDSLGYLLIHHACIKGDALVVVALLHSSCDPSALTDAGLACVHLAAMRGHVVVLSLLAEAGASLEQTDSQGRTPLHYAAANDQVIAVSWLLQARKVNWTTVTDGSGRTPLHLASEAGHEQTVRFLLSNIPHSRKFHERDLMTCDNFGNTCLHSALAPLPNPICSGLPCSDAITNRTSQVLWILLTSSYPDKRTDSKNQHQSLCAVHIKNHEKQTPLDLAVKHHVSFSLRCLLYLAHFFTEKFSSKLSYFLFTLFYRLVWFAHLLLPISIIIPSYFLAAWTQSNWFYLAGALLTLGSSAKQRHRMNDATERPNPYFLGAFIAGFVVSAHCLWYDLSVSVPGWSINYSLVVLILFGPLFCFLLYILTFWPHPSGSLRGRTLVQLVSTDLSRVRGHFVQLQSRPDLPSSFRLIPYSEVYCAHCDVYLKHFDQIPIKHCRLCNRCRVDLDHHCLFIMNCVTRANLRLFLLLLLCIVGFMCSFCLLAVLIPIRVCLLSGDQVQLSCVYERFPRPMVLLPFHFFMGLWTAMLLSEHCYQLSRRSVSTEPRLTRRSFFGGLGLSFQAVRGLMRGDRRHRTHTSMLSNP